MVVYHHANQLEDPVVVTTPTSLFAHLFDRDALLLEARRLGAVKRDRRLHIWDVLLAIGSLRGRRE